MNLNKTHIKKKNNFKYINYKHVVKLITDIKLNNLNFYKYIINTIYFNIKNKFNKIKILINNKKKNIIKKRSNINNFYYQNLIINEENKLFKIYNAKTDILFKLILNSNNKLDTIYNYLNNKSNNLFKLNKLKIPLKIIYFPEL